MRNFAKPDGRRTRRIAVTGVLAAALVGATMSPRHRHKPSQASRSRRSTLSAPTARTRTSPRSGPEPMRARSRLSRIPASPPGKNCLPDPLDDARRFRGLRKQQPDHVLVWDTWTLTDGNAADQISASRGRAATSASTVRPPCSATRSMTGTSRRSDQAISSIARPAIPAFERPKNGGWTYGGNVSRTAPSG